MKTFKLPDMIAFETNDPELSPFEQFHIWCAEAVGGKPADCQINVSANALCEKDYEKLRRMTRRWIKKYHGKHWTKNHVDQALMWHNLEVGPAISETLQENHVSVREDIFVKKEVA